jgi:hypothetical protein
MIKLIKKLFPKYDNWERFADDYSGVFMFPNNIVTKTVRLLSGNNRKVFISRVYFYYCLYRRF